MSGRTSPEVHRRAVEKYNKKTYAQIRVRFNKNKDEDIEILKAIEEMRGDGKSYHDIAVEWYDAWCAANK